MEINELIEQQVNALRRIHMNDKEFIMNVFEKDIYNALSTLMWREWRDDDISNMQNVYQLCYLISLMKDAFCDEDLNKYFWKKFSSMSVEKLFPDAFEKYHKKQDELIADMLESTTEVTVKEE